MHCRVDRIPGLLLREPDGLVAPVRVVGPRDARLLRRRTPVSIIPLKIFLFRGFAETNFQIQNVFAYIKNNIQGKDYPH